MPKYIFSNLIGTFVFDDKFSLEDSILFRDLEQYKNKKQYEEKSNKKYNDLKKPNNNELKKILAFFKNKKYYSAFYNKNLSLTKEQIKESVNEDLLIIQTISNIGEIDKIANTLVKRLREWYSLYNPEFVKSIYDNEKFVELIPKKAKKESSSMGAELGKIDLDPILNLGKQINNLFEFRKNNETYLENLMKKYCPNLNEVAGTLIGAKLLEKAGSLKRMAIMPASTIQILGAEKALFRHLKTKKKAKPPKFGLLFMHPLFNKARRENYGKIARALGDKISIAVKIDYFKGKFIGDKLKKELENKFKQ